MENTVKDTDRILQSYGLQSAEFTFLREDPPDCGEVDLLSALLDNFTSPINPSEALIALFLFFDCAPGFSTFFTDLES
jgi:hypothetical protein